jgi:hypothetical protein
MLRLRLAARSPATGSIARGLCCKSIVQSVRAKDVALTPKGACLPKPNTARQTHEWWKRGRPPIVCTIVDCVGLPPR